MGWTPTQESWGLPKVLMGSVRRSLPIEVIDDIVLIGPVSVPEIGNHGMKVAERAGKKNESEETEGKRKQPQRRGKYLTKVLETGKGEKRTPQVGEVRSNGRTCGDQMKTKCSWEDLEALRFDNAVEQRRMWRNIYAGLGDTVMKEYNDLASSMHSKNIPLNFGPRWRYGRKADVPGILDFWKENTVKNMTATKKACIFL